MISKKQINKFRKIYKKKFNEELSKRQAEELSNRLIQLFKILYKPSQIKIK